MLPYYFIVNTKSSLVLDVKGNDPAAGVSVINYPQKSPPAPNQLWQRVPTGDAVDQGQAFYFFTSKLNGNVIDIEGKNPAPKTPLINYPRKSSGTENQEWRIVESRSVANSFFLVSQLNEFVITVGNPQADYFLTYAAPKVSESEPSQLWHFLPVD